jgi:hypothetical protein
MTLADIEKQEQFLKQEKERIANEAKMQAEADKLKAEIEAKQRIMMAEAIEKQRIENERRE